MKPIFMLAAAAVSASLLLPTVSEAATPDQAVASEQVHYGDLNLASREGQAELERRISSSIRRVCADNGALDLQTRLGFRECVKLAKQQSARQVQLALTAKVNRAHA